MFNTKALNGYKNESTNNLVEATDAKVEPAADPLSTTTTKRKSEHDGEDSDEPSLAKKLKVDQDSAGPSLVAEQTSDASPAKAPVHTALPTPPTGSFSLFLKEDFRDHFCRCPECFPRLAKYPQLLEEEEAYEPPMSESDQADPNGNASVGSGSTYERGEALLSNVDRVRAIGENVLDYIFEKSPLTG